MGIIDKVKTSKYYDISDILKTEAEYYMLLSGRFRGKSYQVEMEVLRDFKENGNKFIYLRRYKEEMATMDIEEWFNNINRHKNQISEIFDGAYDTVVCYRGGIYLAHTDLENDKIVKGPLMGRYVALSRAGQKKSAFQDPAYKSIIFEEFITNEPYLVNEPNKLLDFVATVFRDWKGRVFLIGNTITQVCPYYLEWGLTRVITQPLDSIDLYNIETDLGDGRIIQTRLAVEMVRPADDVPSMYIGHKAKQIAGAATTDHDYPTLKKWKFNWEQIYTIYLQYQAVELAMDLLVNINGDMVVNIHGSDRAFNHVGYDDIIINPDNIPMFNYRVKLGKTTIEQRYISLLTSGKVFFKTDGYGQLFDEIQKNYNFY